MDTLLNIVIKKGPFGKKNVDIWFVQKAGNRGLNMPIMSTVFALGEAISKHKTCLFFFLKKMLFSQKNNLYSLSCQVTSASLSLSAAAIINT